MTPHPAMIRPAGPHDLADIVAINQQGQESVWSAQQFAQALSGTENLWVITRQEQVLGFLIWQGVLDEAEIHHFGVALAAQRQGLASQLLHHLGDFCRSHNIARIFLDVRDGNHGAKALYLSHGFVIIGRRKHYYHTENGPEDAILMEKTC
ncbi:MAG: ribosomal protein S18-alanine N-acetyltransferase [Neisseriaceae bacterium]|nr:ribosomal protein S18-alanine N-acetyltransferase [Neisseriaceae bacterium]